MDTKQIQTEYTSEYHWLMILILCILTMHKSIVLDLNHDKESKSDQYVVQIITR